MGRRECPRVLAPSPTWTPPLTFDRVSQTAWTYSGCLRHRAHYTTGPLTDPDL